MSYIKVRIPIIHVDEDGHTRRATIHRLRSDLPGDETMALWLIMHALSAPGRKPQRVAPFILDEGVLDSEMWLID